MYKTVPLISVVVPIYNVEKYLNECIESIVNQTYNNLEIILVNDGSTDNCAKICDDWINKDERIRVIHKENGGLSSARNAGIDVAKGEYINFIDSDDFISNDFIEFLYGNLIENESDISCCGCYHYFSHSLKEVRHFQNISKTLCSEDAIIYMNTVGYLGVSTCNKLFKISLFEDIRYPIGKLSEDWFILFKLIDKANKVTYDSSPKYYYRQRNGSITKNIKINTDCEEASKECLEFCIDKYPKAVPSAIQSYVLACIGIYNTILCSNYDSAKLVNYKEKIYKFKKDIDTTHLSNSRKIQIKLFLLSTRLYNIIFSLFNIYRKFRYKEGD